MQVNSLTCLIYFCLFIREIMSVLDICDCISFFFKFYLWMYRKGNLKNILKVTLLLSVPYVTDNKHSDNESYLYIQCGFCVRS